MYYWSEFAVFVLKFAWRVTALNSYLLECPWQAGSRRKQLSKSFDEFEKREILETAITKAQAFKLNDIDWDIQGHGKFHKKKRDHYYTNRLLKKSNPVWKEGVLTPLWPLKPLHTFGNQDKDNNGDRCSSRCNNKTKCHSCMQEVSQRRVLRQTWKW